MRELYRLVAWDRGAILTGDDGRAPGAFSDLAHAREAALHCAREAQTTVSVVRVGAQPARAVIYCTPDGMVYPA